MNPKIDRVNKDIDKTKEKISEYQARLRELEKQKTELENTEIVEAVRGMDIPLTDLPAILKALREQNGAPLTSKIGAPAKSDDFAGRGGATERADFGREATERAERSLQRRGPKSENHDKEDTPNEKDS